MLARTLSTATAVLALTSTALAHHGTANYDRSVEIVLEGVVANVAWQNPHLQITLETVNQQGERVLQEIEGGSISTLSPLGLARDSLAVGERISVRARPHRRGPGYSVLGLDATKADGSVVPLIVSAARVRPPSTAVASSLAGRWLRPQRPFLELEAAAPSWPMTAKGRAVFTGHSSQADCVAVGAPQLMLYPHLIDIAVDEKTAVLDLDWMGVRRVVHLDTAAHPMDLEPSPQGHSIGRWEGDALVIDTVGFAEHPEGIGFGLPSGLGKHLVERLALAADGRHLDYGIMAEDPEYLTEPIHAAASWEYSPDLDRSDAACDLEGARRYLEEQ